MRLGVLAADGTTDITGTIVSSGAGNQVVPGTTMAGGYTSGPSITGDTLVCPPGYPYDYNIHDCTGYQQSVVAQDVAQQQADIDACQSGGGIWDSVMMRCISPTPTTASSLIAGIPNSALFLAGGILLFALIAGKR